jgi:release factor glutamine methyltransferase
MNANSKPKTSTVNYWLRDAAEQLAAAGITSALLDAEIILAHTLRKSRTWLHAHSDDAVDARELDIANARLDLRLDRTPIAYIIGHKEFYSRLFKVTPSVLIPRPESEAIITLLAKHLPPGATRLIDIGTGSGCLGITAKLEYPQLHVTLTDISRHALSVAEDNATTLRADVETLRSDLFASIPGRFDIVIANLPYVDRTWDCSPETDAEPEGALFAEHNGFAIIHRFIQQLPAHLDHSGLALIEADPVQHEQIIQECEALSIRHLETDGYVVALLRD